MKLQTDEILRVEQKKEFIKSYKDSIKCSTYKDIFEEIVLKLPDYWWEVSSSSSGRYHSTQDIGLNGNLKHSIKVFKIMCYLTDLECTKELLIKDLLDSKQDHMNKLYLDEYIDILRIAAFIHDGVKYGINPPKITHTVHEHPMLMGIFLANECGDLFGIYGPAFETMVHLIDCHHGEWNTSKHSNAVLSRPVTYGEMLLHQCDYLGSRQDIYMELPEFEKDYGYME